MTPETTLYGIWCFSCVERDADWLRPNDEPTAILAYTSKRAARSKAAGEFGYATYSEMNRDGWAEVRLLETR